MQMFEYNLHQIFYLPILVQNLYSIVIMKHLQLEQLRIFCQKIPIIYFPSILMCLRPTVSNISLNAERKLFSNSEDFRNRTTPLSVSSEGIPESNSKPNSSIRKTDLSLT